MRKGEVLTLRLTAVLKQALVTAAASDLRSTGQYATKVLADHLRARRLLTAKDATLAVLRAPSSRRGSVKTREPAEPAHGKRRRRTPSGQPR